MTTSIPKAKQTFEVWVTSIHGDRLVRKLHSSHARKGHAIQAAKLEGRAVRTLLVEVEQDGKELWCAAGNRRGRAWNRENPEDDE